jgi:rhamnose transport system permease protein
MPEQARRPSRVPRVPLRELPLLVLFAGLMIFFALKSPFFLTEANLQNLGRAFFPELALLTLASALVLLTRGIDLSVAATLALSAVIVGALTVDVGMNVWLASGIAILVGVAAGTLNGVLIVVIGLSPIVATLTTLTLYRGIALGLSGGNSYSGYPPDFARLGAGTVAGIPNQVLIVVVLVMVVAVVLHRTRIGRWIYAVGGNRNAARFAGIPAGAVTIGVYACSGMLSAIAGVISVARFNTARADFATGAELDAITAAILGGISIAGGAGYVVSAIFGALTLAVLRNGMTLLGQSGFLQVIVIGVLLLLCVLADRGFRRLRLRREAAAQLTSVPSPSAPADPDRPEPPIPAIKET